MPRSLIDEAVALASGTTGRRVLLGLAGAPAAGKSTLARRLVDGAGRRLGAEAVGYVPMDGFHLSTAQLDLLGRRDRKGAPDTFDVHGYLHLLRITEGNYLADDGEGWREVRSELDALWYVEAPRRVREERLLRRHVRGGRTEDEAWSFIEASERPNARRVEGARGNCSRIVFPRTGAP